MRVLILTVGCWLLASGCTEPPTGDTRSPEVGARPVGSVVPSRTLGRIDRLEPEIDELIAADAEIEVLAEGFEWAEGPLWIAGEAFLLFSDVPTNRIYRWQEGLGHSVWLEPSGYTGSQPRGGGLGSNGLLLDGQGRLLICQHGDRRVARLEAPLVEPVPEFSTVADRYEGTRFNSPNDAALHSSGALYFTDPPYGLAEGPDDFGREMEYTGVFRVGPDGGVDLLTTELSRPNGIAFSPEESTLYVANSDPERAVWMAFEVRSDGTLDNSRVFFDATPWVEERPGLPDGLKVGVGGHLFATGPGGVLVFDPEGLHLGTIVTTKPTANCAFGGGGRWLYMTADDSLLRVRLAL